jgi:hypothetical protein
VASFEFEAVDCEASLGPAVTLKSMRLPPVGHSITALTANNSYNNMNTITTQCHCLRDAVLQAVMIQYPVALNAARALPDRGKKSRKASQEEQGDTSST